MIAHVVMWWLKDRADTTAFVAALERCARLVDGQQEYLVGTPTPGNGSTADVVLVSRFTTQAALAAYLSHPTHLAVSAEIGPLRATREVVDFTCDS
jgi:hypothetical protein